MVKHRGVQSGSLIVGFRPSNLRVTEVISAFFG